MRRIIVLSLMGMLTAGPAVSAAAWATYTNQQLGYSVMFPGKPVEATGTYRTDLVPQAATHYAKLIDGTTTYVALQVDTGQPDEGTTMLGELEYWLTQIGQVALDNISRLNVGMQYGRFLSLDCRDDVVPEGPRQTMRAKQLLQDAAGLSCPNGSRLTANLFFTQGRLYAVIAIASGPDARTTSAPTRFANSLDWVGSNAEHAKALLDRATAEKRGSTDAVTR